MKIAAEVDAFLIKADALTINTASLTDATSEAKAEEVLRIMDTFDEFQPELKTVVLSSVLEAQIERATKEREVAQLDAER